MENLDLDQLFSNIRIFHDENKDFSDLKKKFDEKLLNEITYETRLHTTLKIITSKFPNKDIRILDYGCGAGRLLFFLYSLGYKNINGCDRLNYIDGQKRVQIDKNNNLFKKIFHLDNVFSHCSEFKDENGKITIYDNQSFDLILSEQVLEHCHNLEGYTDECLRLLDKNGSAYLTFGQRLRPFENHINTWFVHWLPKYFMNIWLNIFRKDRGGSKYYDKLLNLKTVFYFKKLFKSEFKQVDWLTSRYLGEVNIKYYKRKKMIRKIFNFLFNLKFIGIYLRIILAYFANPMFIIHK
jgi:SAM-dependent methyltransferase